MADAISPAKVGNEINEMEKSIRWLVDNMPAHHQYLQNYCPAPASMA